MKLLLALAGLFALGAANQPISTSKVVCYYDSKSYVREGKRFQLYFAVRPFVYIKLSEEDDLNYLVWFIYFVCRQNLILTF